jgi:hypothetical protein
MSMFGAISIQRKLAIPKTLRSIANPSNQTYPFAHNLVTSHYLSGAVRFPVDFELYRRYAEFTDWERFVKQHFPNQEIPQASKDRQQLHKQLDQQFIGRP